MKVYAVRVLDSIEDNSPLAKVTEQYHNYDTCYYQEGWTFEQLKDWIKENYPDRKARYILGEGDDRASLTEENYDIKELDTDINYIYEEFDMVKIEGENNGN